ncbi:hypothetical protein G6F24_016316 [Rhizopus arrhizus]|nr:hypothetical protein G6F24_016316 [Rhizopus arrhizus]
MVVDAQHRVVLPGQIGVDQHRRQRLRQVVGQEARALGIGRQHQQAVDAAAHGTQGRALLLLVTVVAGHQQVLAAVAGNVVDAAHQLGEEFAVQVRKHHAHRIGAAAAQAAGGGVRGVTQPCGHLQHKLADRRPGLRERRR